MRPRGLHAVDLTIQIDHVRPVRAGGATDDENLRFACGWCNRAKSGHMQLYGASSWVNHRIQHPLLGWVSIPRPLWVVRMTQLRARCEDPSGCSATLATNELYVAPKRTTGAFNPSNCRIYCDVHDPWAGIRFVGEKVLSAKSP
ncbi:HNH endonuclease [Actinoallomurus purpureus]|uniref:HNH endonuclease n=1 Tax=Actinoallomurus purpureus TaxID=478114 RepID=UPI003558972F